MSSFYVTCNACGTEYTAEFTPQGYAVESGGEECIECGSNDLECGEKTSPPMECRCRGFRCGC